MTIVVAGTSLLFWLMFIGDALTRDGFYRNYESLTMILGVVSLLVYGALFVVLIAGPLKAWASGARRGYEQRQLWPNGMSS